MNQADREARKKRHQKLFEGQYHTKLGAWLFHGKRKAFKFIRKFKPTRKQICHFTHPLEKLPAPKRLYAQVVLWSMLLMMFSSVNISQAGHFIDEDAAFYDDYLALDISTTFIADDEGFIIKSMPLDGDIVYSQNRSESLTHEVIPGETLSVIAYRYGISVNSVKYANEDIGNINSLSVGQVLNIPPKEGLYVEVESGDSLVSIVEDFEGDLEGTQEFNNLAEGSELIAGTEIFIIGGEKAAPVYVPPVYTASAPTSSVGASSSLPSSAEGWVRPTSGYLTCGWGCYGGHYAYDIANSTGTPIYAARSGTVIKSHWGYGGGYGNHVILDHGDGYQTLYAHNSNLFVSVGQYVSQGQHIAAMGSTGRSSGPHLHIELIYNGRKIHPSNMGVW
jgi:murein DD-endopeptidase MepM/ murein hydrolase activator NlpD